MYNYNLGWFVINKRKREIVADYTSGGPTGIDKFSMDETKTCKQGYKRKVLKVQSSFYRNII